MEASKCGTCFVARLHEVVTVAGLLWISWCVLGAARFRVFSRFFLLRTHTACCKYEAALPHLPLLVFTTRLMLGWCANGRKGVLEQAGGAAQHNITESASNELKLGEGG